MRGLVLVVLLMAGCLGGEPEKELGCGPYWTLTLTEGPAPAGTVVVTAESSALMRYPLWFVMMADQVAARPPEEARAWAEAGYRSLTHNVTEFDLSWLEWSMVASVLDEAAVNEGGDSVGTIDGYAHYRFHVADGSRTFQYDFGVVEC